MQIGIACSDALNFHLAPQTVRESLYSPAPVSPDDTPEVAAERVLEVEHGLYPIVSRDARKADVSRRKHPAPCSMRS